MRWRDDQRISVLAVPRDLAPPDERGAQVRRFEVLEPAQCGGELLVQLPRPDSNEGARALAGTWRRDPAFGESRLPEDAVWAGKLMAVIARPIATAAPLRLSLRLAAERRLALLFGPRRWPLAAAMTVSPEAAVPKELRQQFARAGLAHILAISGLHVGILAGALFALLRALRWSPASARIAAATGIALYIWMLGFPAPALRAGAMIGFWCWARSRQRPPAPGAMLAVTALVVMAVDPWSIFTAGPWLSFAGVWGCTRCVG
ncbi:MAG TPA: ComEC/Rec2 family competence protein [Gemmatimonadales bacterium]